LQDDQKLVDSALASLSAGRKNTAKRLLSSLVAKDATDQQAWLYLALALPSDKAPQALQQVLKLNPQHQTALRLLQILKTEPQAELKICDVLSPEELAIISSQPSETAPRRPGRPSRKKVVEATPLVKEEVPVETLEVEQPLEVAVATAQFEVIPECTTPDVPVPNAADEKPEVAEEEAPAVSEITEPETTHAYASEPEPVTEPEPLAVPEEEETFPEIYTVSRKFLTVTGEDTSQVAKTIIRVTVPLDERPQPQALSRKPVTESPSESSGQLIKSSGYTPRSITTASADSEEPSTSLETIWNRAATMVPSQAYLKKNSKLKERPVRRSRGPVRSKISLTGFGLIMLLLVILLVAGYLLLFLM
jgi:hypothetical protein